MADFIECLGEVHNENISLLTIIQVLNHVVDELYKLSFTRTKFAKAGVVPSDWKTARVAPVYK
jgi:L-asparaginase/Glu-tRNA(Gln) amidotransferase subunit D